MAGAHAIFVIVRTTINNINYVKKISYPYYSLFVSDFHEGAECDRQRKRDRCE